MFGWYVIFGVQIPTSSRLVFGSLGKMMVGRQSFPEMTPCSGAMPVFGGSYRKSFTAFAQAPWLQGPVTCIEHAVPLQASKNVQLTIKPPFGIIFVKLFPSIETCKSKARVNKNVYNSTF